MSVCVCGTFAPGGPLDPGPEGLDSPLEPLSPAGPGIPSGPGFPQGPVQPFSPLKPGQKNLHLKLSIQKLQRNFKCIKPLCV